MNKPRLALAILGIVFLNLIHIDGYKYEFVFDDDQIFQKCSEIPGNNGVADLLDLSELTIGYNDGIIHIDGSTTLVWKVNPTDRIKLQGELFKFERGMWTPTMLSLTLNDFCKDQYKDGTIWHNSWSKYILPEDQICINNYQHVYHYESVDINNIVNLPAIAEGLHKIKVKFEAFDQNEVKNPKSICLEIIGYLLKAKQ